MSKEHDFKRLREKLERNVILTEMPGEMSEEKKRMQKRKIRRLLLAALLAGGIWYFLPSVVIKTPESLQSGWYSIVELKNNRYSDGQRTYEQIKEYFYSPIYKPKNGRLIIKYPLLMWNKIDYVQFGSSWYHSSENLPRSSIIVRNSDLYFFRIYVKCTDGGDFESVMVRKYPWSRKKAYTSFVEAWPYAWEGLSREEGWERFHEEYENGTIDSGYIDQFIVE